METEHINVFWSRSTRGASPLFLTAFRGLSALGEVAPIIILKSRLLLDISVEEPHI